jgi:hypothetical protein
MTEQESVFASAVWSAVAALFVGTLALSAIPVLAQTCRTDLVQGPAAQGQSTAPLTVSKMGSFFFGGKVVRNAAGDTFHADQGYAQYVIPQRAREFPLVMWHGLGQSGKTWESTFDGRDGYLQIFTQLGWPVYIIDQPRRGRAGNTLAVENKPTDIPNLVSEASSWETFRIGKWDPPGAPSFFPGVQFPHDQWAIDQFFGQSTPDTGSEPFPDANQRDFMGRTVAKLFERTGPAVLLTHSHSGQYGWVTAMEVSNMVKAVVAYEPGEFSFPDNEVPSAVATPNKLLESFMAPQLVPEKDFVELTKFPILIIYGDNISSTPSTNFGAELWRLARERAKQFIAAVNHHGGNAQLLELPNIGIYGNTHFPMSDLNNRQVAEQLSQWLHSKGLDIDGRGYQGPLPH